MAYAAQRRRGNVLALLGVELSCLRVCSDYWGNMLHRRDINHTHSAWFTI